MDVLNSVSTLNPSIVHFTIGRRSGNSTRQIDYAIQLLFEGKCIKVRDHYKLGLHGDANQNLFVRIIDRITKEHCFVYDKLEFDKINLFIQLIQK